jgi:hypothetical protein
MGWIEDEENKFKKKQDAKRTIFDVSEDDAAIFRTNLEPIILMIRRIRPPGVSVRTSYVNEKKKGDLIELPFKKRGVSRVVFYSEHPKGFETGEGWTFNNKHGDLVNLIEVSCINDKKKLSIYCYNQFFVSEDHDEGYETEISDTKQGSKIKKFLIRQHIEQLTGEGENRPSIATWEILLGWVAFRFDFKEVLKNIS